MDGARDIIQAYGSAAFEAIAETLWPTRCAVCDAPGEVLCDACRRSLPYLDWWRACHRCGAPQGRIQCSECNRVALRRFGRERPPFASCASAVVLDDATGRIVRTYKDQGERRLADELACAMARVAHPAWIGESPTIVAVPATGRARRRRGFDHMDEVARRLAAILGLALARPLAQPRSADQRRLGGRERIGNMRGRFKALPGADVPERVLLVDDVYTTGATLFDATDALLAAGARQVRCLTYARVW